MVSKLNKHRTVSKARRSAIMLAIHPMYGPTDKKSELR